MVDSLSGGSSSIVMENRISVAGIKRVDPYVRDILAKSTHVAIYRFSPAASEWQRTETEGALFLYSRNGEPFHSMMVLNRLNANNLIEPLVADFEYQMQPPFLLYRNARGKIYGIWFYNRDECVDLTLRLEQVMEAVTKDRPALDKIDHTEGVDIFKLLSKAQEDFNKTPVKVKDVQQQLQSLQQQQQQQPPPLPQFSSTPRASDLTSQSVMDFFAKAGSKSVSKAPHSPVGDVQFTLQRLMSNPAHSVEHIEKQQRSTTPQDVPKSSHAENGVNLLQLSRSASPLTHFLSQSSNPASKLLDREAGVLSPLAQLLDTSSSTTTTTTACTAVPPSQKPALMPPTMFSADPPAKSSATVEPLTRNQMLQALTYMLRNDADFITKLHEAYVKSLTEMVSSHGTI